LCDILDFHANCYLVLLSSVYGLQVYYTTWVVIYAISIKILILQLIIY